MYSLIQIYSTITALQVLWQIKSRKYQELIRNLKIETALFQATAMNNISSILLFVLVMLICTEYSLAQFPEHPYPDQQWQVATFKKARVKQIKLYVIRKGIETLSSEMNFSTDGLILNEYHFSGKVDSLRTIERDTFFYEGGKMVKHLKENLETKELDSIIYLYRGTSLRKHTTFDRYTYSKLNDSTLKEVRELKSTMDSDDKYFEFTISNYILSKNGKLIRVLTYFPENYAKEFFDKKTFSFDSYGRTISSIEIDDKGKELSSDTYKYNIKGLIEYNSHWFRFKDQLVETDVKFYYSFY